MRFKLHPLYIALAAVFIVLGEGVVFLINLGVVVMHEYVHYIVARGKGITAGSIVLYPYGGQINLDSSNLATVDEIKILLSAPLVNLIFSTLILGLWWVFPALYPYTEALYDASLYSGIVNLLFLYPLDGGRVLLSLLKLRMKKARAISIVMWIGYIGTALLFVLGIFAAINKNITVIIFSLFIFVNQFELRGMRYNNGFLSDRKNMLIKGKGLERKTIVVHSSVPVYRLLSMTSGDAYYFFDIVGDDCKSVGRISEQELIQKAKDIDIYISIGNYF